MSLELVPRGLNPYSAMFKRRIAQTALQVASLLTCLTLWDLACRYKLAFLCFDFRAVPSPESVAVAATDLFSSTKVLSHVGHSLVRVFSGFGLAILTGIALGLTVGSSRWAAAALLPPLEVLRPIPAVAWVPLAILMIRSAEGGMIFITFLGALFPILVSTRDAVARLDQELTAVARTLGAGRTAVFTEVVLPGVLPSVVTGLTVGMGTAWFSLVTAEMISGRYGIGYFTWEAYNLQKYPSIVLGMLIIGLLGTGSSVLVRFIGGLLMPWRRFEGRS